MKEKIFDRITHKRIDSYLRFETISNIFQNTCKVFQPFFPIIRIAHND